MQESKTNEENVVDSVHEEVKVAREGEGVRGEVAGLEDSRKNENLNDSEERKSLLVGKRENRRPRPHSLAVQPLNYQRLDPDAPRDDTDEDSLPRRSRHRKMTSQESIGNCSLDVDRSASDRSEPTLDSVSERTLHSLNLSCNGDSPKENLSNGSNETLHKRQEADKGVEIESKDEKGPRVKVERVNGEKKDEEGDQVTAKKPSYLGLACSISGYSGITRYDSKLREGFRSRDSSPGSRLITRETSPAGFRSSENLGVPGLNLPPKSQSISPLAMDRRNGFANGKECKIESSFVETTKRTTLGSFQGYSEVDRGLNANFSDISPIRSASPIKRTQASTHITSSSFNRESRTYTTTFSVSSPRPNQNVSSNSFSDTSLTVNGSSEMIENQSLNSTSSEKSFIQQRVERLYGPGALAQGFFFKRASHASCPDASKSQQTSTSTSATTMTTNNNDKLLDDAEESLKNLPVLRHLRPEFRAQLPVVSPRRATDGSEQIIKPLQRLSTSQRKSVESSEKSNVSTDLRENRENETLKLSASVTSIPDQQPAAPEVVLPVLEMSASSTSIPAVEKTTEESPLTTTEEKHGHHFLRLLNAERDRLLVLAESAEAELENAEPGSLPEEAEGKLRSAAGKARLLAKQKMQQFEGLCHKNISQVPGKKFPTTYEDLAGFWDMVMLQVVQVNEIFAQIEKLKSSQWQEITPEKTSTSGASQNGNSTKRRVASQKPKTASSEASRKAREAREQARRKMMDDRRRAMRSNVQKESEDVTIFAPET